MDCFVDVKGVKVFSPQIRGKFLPNVHRLNSFESIQ